MKWSAWETSKGTRGRIHRILTLLGPLVLSVFLLNAASADSPVVPRSDSRLIYVSSSTGDDANDGLSSGTPKRTFAAATALLRDGFPDWMLLKRGDSWQEGLAGYNFDGRSAAEPAVITAYGAGGSNPSIDPVDARGALPDGQYVVIFNVDMPDQAGQPDHTISSDIEWDALFANTDTFFDNKIIEVSGSNFTPRSLVNRTFTNLTLQSADEASSLPKLDLIRVSGLTLDGLNFVNDNSTGQDFIPIDAFQMLVIAGGSSVTVTGCTFDGESGVDKLKRFGGIRATASRIAVIDCIFSNIRDGIVANYCHAEDSRTVVIHGCHFTNLYEDAITGLDSDWSVIENTATMFEGHYGKRFFGTITGSITPGQLLSNGASGDAEKVLYVIGTDNATYVDGYYNNWRKPSNGDSLTGDTGGIDVVSSTMAFDGIHGDFFQPLMNTATANRSLEVKRNFVYRSTPYGFGALQTEQNVEGVLAQLNGSTYKWSSIDISYNVFAGGQPIGIVVRGALSGTIRNNTILWSEYGFPADIDIADCTGVTLVNNTGDNNTGGVIDDNGGNTNLAIGNNVFVSGRDGSQEAVYVSPFTYPQSLSGLAPQVGSIVDTSNSGALTPSGTFRSERDPQ